jgi:hypothetical protein
MKPTPFQTISNYGRGPAPILPQMKQPQTPHNMFASAAAALPLQDLTMLQMQNNPIISPNPNFAPAITKTPTSIQPSPFTTRSTNAEGNPNMRTPFSVQQSTVSSLSATLTEM